MNRLCLLLCFAPLCALGAPDGGPGASAALEVPLADREAETARLRALGVDVPDGGIVLARPFDPPYSRRSFVVPQAWFKAPAADAGVQPEALAADLEVLEAVMGRAYGGWENAAERGFDWAAFFAGWRKSLQEAPAGVPLPLATAFAPMRTLMEFQLDNHTTVPLARGLRFGSGSRSARLAAPVPAAARCEALLTAEGRSWPLDAKDPAQRVRSAVRFDAAKRKLVPVSYLAYPAARGAPAQLRCGGKSVPFDAAFSPAYDDPARRARILALSGETEDGPALKVLAPDVAYLRLPTFSKRSAQLLEQRQPSWPKPTGKEKVLIVDLRDNDGGDVAVEALAGWVEQARLEKAFKAALAVRKEGASCLYPALRWGYTSFSSQGLKPPVADGLKQMLAGSVSELFGDSPPDCPIAFKRTSSGWDFRAHKPKLKPGAVQGQRRILTLVNDACGSDCELMTALLATLPETVIAGVNTYGVAQYIQPGYSVLPRTRLPFRIALGSNDPYGDGRSFDGYGYGVDVLLDQEADWAPEALLKLARYLGGR